MTPQEDLAFRLALESVVDNAFPIDEAATTNIIIPFLGSGRSTGVKLGGHHFFHDPSEDPEEIKRAKSESLRQKTLLYLGTTPEEQGGAIAGALGGLAIGGAIGGPLAGPAVGAIGGLLGGSALGGLLNKFIGVPARRAGAEFGSIFRTNRK